MAFTIQTSLGSFTPRVPGGDSVEFPIHETNTSEWDNINGEPYPADDWTKTTDIANVVTRFHKYAFRQGVSYAYRKVAKYVDDVLDGSMQVSQYYPPTYYGFTAYYTNMEQTEAKLFFIWCTGDYETAQEYMNQIISSAGDPNHFGYDLGTFIETDFPEERDWDESPSTDDDDPTNMNASGGEFADTDRYDITDLITTFDMQPPEEMDYGKLLSAIVLHEDQTHGYDLTQLNNCLFLADFWQNLKNKFEGLSDPLSMIISTLELPFTPIGNGTTTMKLGGITVVDSQDQPILVERLGTRYSQASLGTIDLKEVWGTEKDYTQTSVEIFLPYVGVREIDVDLAVNYWLTLYCTIDRWTGDILYRLHATNKHVRYKYMTSEFVAYRWNGNCAKTIPLGKVDNTSAILSLLGIPAKAVGGAMIGGGIGSAVAGGSAILNTNLSPNVQSSGSLSGNIGRMDFQFPYLIIKRGVPVYPSNWRKEFGATRFQEFRVGDLAGYTEFFEIHADDIPGATDSEKAEIENLLKSGVFIN